MNSDEKSNVVLQGPGPFYMPVAQDAKVTGHLNNGVTLTLYSIFAERSDSATPVSVQLTAKTARVLAAELLAGADFSEGAD